MDDTLTERIVLDLDEDILDVAREQAERTGEPLGKVISRMARHGHFALRGPVSYPEGFESFWPSRPLERIVTLEHVQRLQEQLDYEDMMRAYNPNRDLPHGEPDWKLLPMRTGSKRGRPSIRSPSWRVMKACRTQRESIEIVHRWPGDRAGIFLGHGNHELGIDFDWRRREDHCLGRLAGFPREFVEAAEYGHRQRADLGNAAFFAGSARWPPPS